MEFAVMVVPEQAPLVFSSLKLAHIPYVMHIESEAYPEPWTYNMFRQELDNENSYFCVVFSSDTLIGYGGFWLMVDEAHITRVTIVPELRGRGMAKILMVHLLQAAAERGAVVARLEVRESNLPALRLYENMGFIREGRRKAYYQNSNEDAIVMMKPMESLSS
jgi:[ribosomal protein S18]-alanine N-acetyltransferase